MKTILFLTAALAAATAATAASAGIPVKQKMTCPIGGAEFEHTSTASYSTSGERPDGKPYGSWTFPMALPECPGNGLVLYKEYEPDEVAKLEPLIASDAYQALRSTGETQYYRAYWLMREMGVEPSRSLWALLQAAWETDKEPERRARYLAELAEASAAVEAKPEDLNWLGMEARSVNALRELGRFDEALARLEAIPAAATAAGGTGKQAETRAGWASYLGKLRAAIERRDASAEPFDMLPRNIALGRCLDGGDGLDEHQRGFCERESASVEEMRAKRAELDRQLKVIGSKTEDSGR